MELNQGTCQRMLTASRPGIGGRLKAVPDDFRVEEIPLYSPVGTGEHAYFEIEKRGISTFRAINELARALNTKPQEFGYAGLKDAQAVTRQTFSVAQVHPETILALNVPAIRVLWVKRHTNKLKMGHLAGNRFVIRVRDVPQEALNACHAILDVLTARGVPNYFGVQRFGNRQDTHILGRAIVQNNPDGFMHAYLGKPQPNETPAVREARRLFDSGSLEAALNHWPPQFGDERRALRELITGREQAARRALRSVPKRMRTFFVSAYQAHLFNLIMDARLDTLDQVQAGDVATKHDSGASFLVTDPELEQPRADRFEISPSGPIYGYRTLLAEGNQGKLERSVLSDEGMDLDAFKATEGMKLKGARRPLRFPLKEVDAWYDDGVVVTFVLPAGSYATNVMAEITKNSIDQLA